MEVCSVVQGVDLLVVHVLEGSALGNLVQETLTIDLLHVHIA